jgi:hypothetical protein
VAYFLSNHFALGLDLNAYGAQNGETFKVSGYRISPYARYYLPLENPAFAFLFEAGGGYGFDRSNHIEGETWRLHGGAGLSIFVTPSLALELYFGAANEFPAIGTNGLKPEARVGFQVLLPKRPAAERELAHYGALRHQSIILGVTREFTNSNFEAIALLMLSDRLAFGGGVNTPTVTIMSDGEERIQVAEVTGLLPILRYFPGAEPTRRLRPYFGAGSSFRWTSDDEVASSRFKLAPYGETGLLYFLRPELALEGNFRYQLNTQALRSASSEADSRLLFRLGFQYFIPAKN